MLCPVCEIDLVMSERQGIEIDYCPKCRGVWLDRGELDKIIERTNQQISQSSGALREDDDVKRKNDYRHTNAEKQKRKRGYEDDDNNRRLKKPHKKRDSILEEIFDIFD